MAKVSGGTAPMVYNYTLANGPTLAVYTSSEVSSTVALAFAEELVSSVPTTVGQRS